MLLVRLLLVMFLVTSIPALAAGPYGVIKCQSGTPIPTKYTQSVNGTTAIDVLPHLGADGSTYYVVDASLLPQTAGVSLAVAACNPFGCNSARTYVVDVGIPAPMGAIEWRTSKP